ncbi:hypothetical protein IFM89_021508, partial [Coptis chinensis]
FFKIPLLFFSAQPRDPHHPRSFLVEIDANKDKMLGDFVIRSLVMVLGYAYPAFECYKTVEKNRVEIEQFRFWCQYWIIIAALTILERFGDIFVSWLPLYGELKLCFIVYLWSPKTKGTSYVYETFLRPYISRYETDIDRNLMEYKAIALDWAMFSWHYCVANGQSTFYRILEYLAAQSSRNGKTTTQKSNPQYTTGPSLNAKSSIHRQPDKQKPQPDKNRRPSSHFMVSQTEKLDIVQKHLPYQTLSLQTSETTANMGHTEELQTTDPESPMAETTRSFRIRLRR